MILTMESNTNLNAILLSSIEHAKKTNSLEELKTTIIKAIVETELMSESKEICNEVDAFSNEIVNELDNYAKKTKRQNRPIFHQE